MEELADRVKISGKNQVLSFWEQYLAERGALRAKMPFWPFGAPRGQLGQRKSWMKLNLEAIQVALWPWVGGEAGVGREVLAFLENKLSLVVN